MPRITLASSLALAASVAAGPAGAQPLPPERPPLVDVALPPEIPRLAGLPGPVLRGRDLYFPMAAAEARAHGLPPEVADAVMRVESGYDPGTIGGVGERGLMQVLPTTAAMLGFRGAVAELADPATNIRLGVRYLAGAWRLAGGDLCRALMKYRAGHGEERMSPLSAEYCRRARAHLAALGSPLAAGAAPAADLSPAPVPTRRGGRAAFTPTRISLDERSRRFWAAHMIRIRAIEARLRWKRGGIMART